MANSHHPLSRPLVARLAGAFVFVLVSSAANEDRINRMNTIDSE
jgi:hypothetical protein